MKKTAFLGPIILGLGLILATAGMTSMASAHDGAKGVTKERMDLMKDLADAMKAMGGMFKGEAPFEPDLIADKAAYLADHAKMIPEMTPDGSNDHPSEALAIIWQEWDGYVASAKQLAEEGAKLIEVANSGADQAQTRAQYAKVGKTCGTCHDRYRKPKE